MKNKLNTPLISRLSSGIRKTIKETDPIQRAGLCVILALGVWVLRGIYLVGRYYVGG